MIKTEQVNRGVIDLEETNNKFSPSGEINLVENWTTNEHVTGSLVLFNDGMS